MSEGIALAKAHREKEHPAPPKPRKLTRAQQVGERREAALTAALETLRAEGVREAKASVIASRTGNPKLYPASVGRMLGIRGHLGIGEHWNRVWRLEPGDND